MIGFDYVRPSSVRNAIDALARDPHASIIAGGTNLVDLMKMGVTSPEKIIDINGLPLREIEKHKDGIRIGALALNTDVAEHKLIADELPLLSLAIKAGASPQIRNMATVGGNMLQRTRCPYFFDTVMPCNKREPGSGCGALNGYNRMHAILGASDKCIAVHPSDMCVALSALDAKLLISGTAGDRIVPINEFLRLPGDTPELDNNLARGEIITGIDIPANAFSRNAYYLKIRDRSSYAFALVSVAAALDLTGSTINGATLAMGGVAHKPWRLSLAEQFLKGKPATESNFKEASVMDFQQARGYGRNNFKIKMASNAVFQSLKAAAKL